MPTVAIIEKSKSGVNYKDFFDFEYDLYQLCDTNVKRVLKKDITIDFEHEFYDYVIVVGKDPAKHIAGISSVMKYQGYLYNDKYLAMANPSMLRFKPEGQSAFDKAIADINDVINGVTKAASDLRLDYIQTEEELTKYLDFLDEQSFDSLALDTETTALYPRDGYILGVCLAHAEDHGVYILSDAVTEELSDRIQKLLLEKVIVFHNMKFDISFTEYHFNWKYDKVEDTQLLHYCLDEKMGGHDLKQLAIRYTDLADYDKELEIFKREYCKRHGMKLADFTYDLIPPYILAEYGATDPVATLRLFNLFYDKVQNSPRIRNVYETLLKPGSHFLRKMENNGVPIDREVVEAELVKKNKEIEELWDKLYTYEEIHKFEEIQGAKLNINSPKQLIIFFFNIMKLPIPDKRTEAGAISVDAEVLEDLAKLHEIPTLVLKIKKAQKVKNTYLEKMLGNIDADGRLRTNFNLTTTTSGRLSSSGKINMQQMPRDDKSPKRCIRAKDGRAIVSQDLQTAEMYIVGALSGDKVLQSIFINGEDYHSQIAKLKFDLPYTWQEIKRDHSDIRQDAKTVSFEILYKLNLREPILKKFKTLRKWLEEQAQFIEQNGYTYSFFGRKRRLKDVFSTSNEVKQHALRSGVNALVQGPASDVNLYAGIELQEYIEEHNLDALIFAQVHDSIVADVAIEDLPEYIKNAVRITQKDRGLSIPGTPIGVDVEYGQDYSFETDLKLPDSISDLLPKV